MNIFSNLFASVYASPILGGANNICTFGNHARVYCNGSYISGALWLSPFVFFVTFIVSIIVIAGMWKMFMKAGRPGWASIIPIYNLVVMLEIINRPVWWIIFYFIPFVNAVVSLVVVYELAKAYGKGIGFTLGMIFLPFIFYPILGFGDAVYHHHAK
jgi:hypothetical protein